MPEFPFNCTIYIYIYIYIDRKKLPVNFKTHYHIYTHKKIPKCCDAGKRKTWGTQKGR